jgi:hypothetical protein
MTHNFDDVENFFIREKYGNDWFSGYDDDGIAEFGPPQFAIAYGDILEATCEQQSILLHHGISTVILTTTASL